MNIIDFIKNFIRIEFSFESGKTVSSITANLTKTVKDLEAHAADQLSKANSKAQKADELYLQHHNHNVERKAALKVAENIKSLLG